MIGYVLTAFLLVASAIYFVALNLGYGLPDFGYYTLYNTIFMLLFYFPVLTMRSFAEERRTRTDQLLLTSPVPVPGIVLGKFFALCVVFALPCVVDAVMILTLQALGATAASTLANFAALLCYYLLGCAAIAIGVFLSSLTENQIIAAVAGAAALLLAYLMPSLRRMFTTGSAVAPTRATASRPDRSLLCMEMMRGGGRGEKRRGPLGDRDRSENFNGDRVGALVYEGAQRIIHKPVLRHAAFSGEDGRCNAHAKVCPPAAGVCAGMACMSGALVDHFELGWLKPAAQTFGQGLCRGDYGVHRALIPLGPQCPWAL